MKKKLIIGAIILAVLAIGGVAAYMLLQKRDAAPEPQTPQPTVAAFDKNKHSITEPGSLWWIVSKTRPLPDGYVPAQLVNPNMKLRWAPIAESMTVSQQIAPDLESLYKASQAAGFDLMLVSGYRSQVTQKELYDGYVASQGQEAADRISARPGTSEHQTGMVVDIGRSDRQCELDTCFGDTPEGKWLAEHAHEYGFIIRYPQGKEAIVGYQYEPWHIRYVGKELAAELYKTNQTMEEFFIGR
jgi:D-alanyl-D-alanine carboxypeptidase